MPKVSVAMASYNHAPYVAAALQSVLDQSFQDFEIVVTDDGSSDATVEEARKVGDRRISVTALPRNVGACTALNSSICRSSGPYVAILNSDDVFLPGKLERQVQFLDEHPEIGAVFGYPEFIDEQGRKLTPAETFYGNTFQLENRSRAEWLRHFFFYGNALCHPSVLIRRRCYEAVGLYNPALAQIPDLEMWIRLLHQFDIHLFEEPLVGFRILKGDQNASAGKPDAIARVHWEVFKVLPHYLTLDRKLFASAFPELPAASSVTPKHVGLRHRLRRILGVKVAMQGCRSAERPATHAVGTSSSALPVSWFFGRLACQMAKPAYVLFGLDLMYQVAALIDDPDVYREFIRYSGGYDVFDVLSKVPHLPA